MMVMKLLKSISEKTASLGKASYCGFTIIIQVLENNLQVSTLGGSKNFQQNGATAKLGFACTLSCL